MHDDLIIAATVRITTNGKRGQGVLIPDGMILTAAHCLDWSNNGGMAMGDVYVEDVETADGRKFRTEPIFLDPLADIGVLGKVSHPDLYEDFQAFMEFWEATTPAPLSTIHAELFQDFAIKIRSHEGKWINGVGKFREGDRRAVVFEASEQVMGGTSGGPVVDEGMSIRGVSRVTGLCKRTLCDLILTVGENCERLLESQVLGVATKDVQCDEIWSFVGMKERQRHAGNFIGEEGNSWTFIAIDRDTKLVLAHHVGQRDGEDCVAFLHKLEDATTGRFQISTDGLSAYTLNIPFLFRERVDFGQLIKNFAGGRSTGRYSPGKIIRAEKRPMYGDPDVAQICTSHVERFNLTMRMAVLAVRRYRPPTCLAAPPGPRDFLHHGFWGQNFNDLPFESNVMMAAMLASCAIVPAGMVYFFMRSKWF